MLHLIMNNPATIRMYPPNIGSQIDATAAPIKPHERRAVRAQVITCHVEGKSDGGEMQREAMKALVFAGLAPFIRQPLYFDGIVQTDHAVVAMRVERLNV